MAYKKTSLALLALAISQQIGAQESSEEAVKDDVTIEEVVVWGERAADRNAREMERGKDIFSSAISQDDAGNFADQNVAESLRRLPGVTLQRSEGEGKFVTVRGLGPGFVTVSMNGSELASAAGDDRAFALDALPSDLLGSIEVYKSLTPDMDLNSIGGVVNVNAISAFDRGRNSLKLKGQATLQNSRDEVGGKIALSGTRFLIDDILGLGFAFSHEDRSTQVDEIRHHSSGEMIFRQQDIPDDIGPTILAPRQLETRQELADRSRTAGSMNLEFRPNSTSSYYARGSYSTYDDTDVALREFFDFQDAGSGEVAYVNDVTGEFVLSDIDVFHQYFIQEGTNSTSAASVGGENFFGNDMKVDYDFSWSKSNWDKPNGRRAQFRESDLVVWGQGFADSISGRVLTPAEGAAMGGFDVSDFSSSDIRGDASTLDNFHYDNLFIEDSFREDKLQTFSMNLEKTVDSGGLNYLRTGFQVRSRDRDRNKDRWSFDPDDGAAGCDGDAECLDVINSNHSDYANHIPSGSNFTYPFVTHEEVERIIAASRVTQAEATNGEVSIDSTKEDYLLTENTFGTYFMGEFQVHPDATLIVGARYESTEFNSSGFFSIENDDFAFVGDEASRLDIAIPLEATKTTYNKWFPSMHLRYTPREDVLVRGAIWTSYTRPSFAQARAYAKIDSDIELCVPGTRVNDEPGTGDCDDSAQGGTPEELQSYELARDNSIQIGNPHLNPMTSTNFDASISWYADENLFLQAAVFYKDISDFIVDISGAELGLDELPLQLPLDQVSQFYIPNNLVLDDVDTTLNGDSAKVYGIELSYSQFFNNGLFLQSNLTFLDSEAKLNDSIRTGTVQLPDQADTVLNVAGGWENDEVSLRLIANYRSEVLEQVGACSASADPTDPTRCKTWADRYQGEILNLDFKANWHYTDNVSFYFDAINMTDETDHRYFAGNEMSRGPALYQLERYGRSYQLGFTVDFD